ncbi:hypothetical protein CPB84DRAFT_480604 [Gymnopilus junonius]|uniref:Chromo domain-containing protein n=1 Tax=Gymnopilus junonius TaxID=109634 RepID=A0A9P5P083_GYMJU|nr:hypothetical protein CPB84DRAFT_480604 [Gymnopilus junonius]
MGKGKKTKKLKEEESEGFPVEVITKARVVPVDDENGDGEGEGSTKKEKQSHQDAKWEYYVKWAGYGDDANSWEPEENLESCERLLGSFWSHVGMDEKDYPIGYVVKAKKSWIKSEMEYFARESQNLREEIKRLEKETVKSKKVKKEKRKTSQDVSPIPQKRLSRSKSTSLVPTNEHDSTSDSEDDKPLSQSAPSLKTKSSVNQKRKRQIRSSSEEEPQQDLQSQRSPKRAKIETSKDIQVCICKVLPVGMLMTMSIVLYKGRRVFTTFPNVLIFRAIIAGDGFG